MPQERPRSHSAGVLRPRVRLARPTRAYRWHRSSRACGPRLLARRLARDGHASAVIDFEFARTGPRDLELISVIRAIDVETRLGVPRPPLLAWLAEDYPELFLRRPLDDPAPPSTSPGRSRPRRSTASRCLPSRSWSQLWSHSPAIGGVYRASR